VSARGFFEVTGRGLIGNYRSADPLALQKRIRRCSRQPVSLPFHGPIAPDLLDVVHQTIELPLRVDLSSRAQREALQSAACEVSKDGFHRARPSGVDGTSWWRVDFRLHGLGVRMAFMEFALEESDLSIGTDVRLSQALASQRAAPADVTRALEGDGPYALDHGVLGASASFSSMSSL